MLALLQRVTAARVEVAGELIARIDTGLLVLAGVERGDQEAQAKRLAERLCGYRMFADHDGKMNLSVNDIDGGILLVPQFTLPADTSKGMRPSFSAAADPELGEYLFNTLVDGVRHLNTKVHTGRFGADMQITLTNDGPVTFMLQVRLATA